ncbi:hypothetical protein H072_10871 [Dactylellina haptotyla CBS 200.50]|uniref:Complex III subunit 7 n=1 Tax=Dactylellina haptotyla (strain CBS 200.50) TaxID=1284197 RepID=S8A3K7_DACHA|nr:hypothetical protein H072_10871 [Dactylellina haptotyla CBS 200.50]
MLLISAYFSAPTIKTSPEDHSTSTLPPIREISRPPTCNCLPRNIRPHSSPQSVVTMSSSKAVKMMYNYVTARPRLFNFIKPIADRYCDLAGYRKVGLMYEDMLREETHTVQLALKRLPPRLAYDRAFRIRRALQCSITHSLLPKEDWIKPEEDVPYLSPYIEEVEKEEAERKMFDAMTRK